MIQWFYRYVFRGAGILLAIGIITIFVLAVSSQLRQSGNRQTPAAETGARR
jgi:hypothetical protein